jgi:lipid-binding SYLF domain-containing protein
VDPGEPQRCTLSRVAVFGFQIGGQATDLILLVMNGRGMESILSSKVKLGADASVAAGPKGRDASANTDAWMRAEILSYSRSRGLFAGVSLEGSTFRPDDDASADVYGLDRMAQRTSLEVKVWACPQPAVILSMHCRRARRATNRSERRISRSAWPASGSFLWRGQLAVLRRVVQQNGLLNV